MYQVIKRIFDFISALLSLIVLSPIFLFTIIGILISDWGPIFYKANRIGKGNKPFKMYKFRSMRQQTDEEEQKGWSHKNDPRVTKIGSIMRRTSIDELPQMFNVLKGDMSLVGPRPFLANDKTLPDMKISEKRYLVKPGITGLAQISGGREITNKRRS